MLCCCSQLLLHTSSTSAEVSAFGLSGHDKNASHHSGGSVLSLARSLSCSNSLCASRALLVEQGRRFSVERVRQITALAGNYGNGIQQSARYYSSNGINQGQYRRDLTNALRGSGASAAAAASGSSQTNVHVHVRRPRYATLHSCRM